MSRFGRVPEDDPIALLGAHYREAAKLERFDAARVALATSTKDGQPSVRFVLVREIDDEGFFFYTSYLSRKARELEESPRAALAWHWESIGVQARVEGPVKRASAARSDAYFAGRPRGSQLGAWASPQSRPIASRAELEARARAAAERFEGGPVPRPPDWGGYVLRPERIELWYEGEDRLHTRHLFERDRETWVRSVLAP